MSGYKRGVLVHAPTLRYCVDMYSRNVVLLGRGWGFRLVDVDLQEHLVNKNIQVFQTVLQMVAPLCLRCRPLLGTCVLVDCLPQLPCEIFDNSYYTVC
jgi:hypothetical protein